jgi:hypothetical protein
MNQQEESFKDFWLGLKYHVPYNEIKLWETPVYFNGNQDKGWSLQANKPSDYANRKAYSYSVPYLVVTE